MFNLLFNLKVNNMALNTTTDYSYELSKNEIDIVREYNSKDYELYERVKDQFSQQKKLLLEIVPLIQ